MMHAIVTAGYAVVLVAAAVSSPELSRAGRGDAVAIVVAAVAVAYLSYAAMTVVPQTRVLARPGRG